MVQVFKTSVKTKADIKKLKPKLENLSTHLRWNFDLQNCDHVLRAETIATPAKAIMDILHELTMNAQNLE